jgi:aspartate 1-decarboxylase
LRYPDLELKKEEDMFRLMLRSKIHRATVTDANLEYEGSLTVDPVLLEAAGMLPYEQVSISNLNNGERFETYVIPGTRGRGEMVLNGPTARKGLKGDKVIVFCYEYFNEEELKTFKPKIVLVDENNRLREK